MKPGAQWVRRAGKDQEPEYDRDQLKENEADAGLKQREHRQGEAAGGKLGHPRRRGEAGLCALLDRRRT